MADPVFTAVDVAAPIVELLCDFSGEPITDFGAMTTVFVEVTNGVEHLARGFRFKDAAMRRAWWLTPDGAFFDCTGTEALSATIRVELRGGGSAPTVFTTQVPTSTAVNEWWLSTTPDTLLGGAA